MADADMLVKLYALPPLEEATACVHARGIRVRRALPPEKHLVLGWVAEHCGHVWGSECDVAFARQPVSCFLAARDDELLFLG